MSTYFIEIDGFHTAGEIIMEFIISFTEYLNHYLKAIMPFKENISINKISTLTLRQSSFIRVQT